MPEHGSRIIRWHKSSGDPVVEGEPICELENDRATVDLPAWATGTIYPLKEVGDQVDGDNLVATIIPDLPL